MHDRGISLDVHELAHLSVATIAVAAEVLAPDQIGSISAALAHHFGRGGNQNWLSDVRNVRDLLERDGTRLRPPTRGAIDEDESKDEGDEDDENEHVHISSPL